MSWEKNIRKVVPYIPGEQPDFENMIKLNTNENPYPPAPGVKRVMDEFPPDKLRLYPSVDGGELSRVLAERYGRSVKETFVGVGSDDVLAVAFLTCFDSEKPILFPDITYSFYDVWADLYRIPYERIPLDDSFRIRKEDYVRENGGIVIANPNAPTSVAMGLSDIEYIVANNPESIVIIDEAYVDFGGESAIALLDRYDNLIVVQTFSKARSMAGMRIGYAFACEKLIEAMNDVKFSINSYTMNQTSLFYGVEAVKDEEYFRTNLEKVIKTRENTVAELDKLGFSTLPSSTNFIFTTHESIPASRIFEELRKSNIFVRHFNKKRIDNYLRVTIGTDEQMKVFIQKVTEIVKSK